ncbi:MAG: efflux RND transporter periplasmic adaptor subunit [Desulfuromonadales bacterium]|nr:efflux RND transporter periplasmic adaptor subunit [Desulfuromonadales bacterium]
MRIYRLKRWQITLMIFCLSFALVSCGNSEEKTAAAIDTPEKVVSVTIEQVVGRDLQDSFILPASLEAWEDLILAAEIAGPVRKFNYREGERVETGDVLLEIDPETLQTNLVMQEENYRVSNRKLKRYQKLSVEGLISQQELDELNNSQTAAAAALRATRLQLARCFPKAPVSGVVDRHFVDRGEYVDLGKPLLRLVQVDRLKVIVDVPEKDVQSLQVGQSVEIIPATMNGNSPTEITGTIDSIAFSADLSTRTYRTKMILDNSAGNLRPGMIVRARFLRRLLTQVITAPLYAVLDREGEKLVYVEDQGIARRLKVVTGRSVGRRIVITSGLSAGQHLIVSGQQLLIDGARVQVEER